MSNLRHSGPSREAFAVAAVMAVGASGGASGQCEVANLLAADGETIDQLGRSAAIDGDSAVVGAPGESAGGSNAGAAYVFVRDGMGAWQQQQKLVASNAAANDFFGNSVSISGDLVIVGAPQSFPGTGTAYIFERSGGVWTQTAKLTASDADPGDQFGASVAIDGCLAVIGAFGDDELALDAGAAYVVECVGGTWSEQAKLTASNGGGGHAFGSSVDVNGDIAFVGAPGGGGKMGSTGSAYVFRQLGGTWPEVAALSPSDGGNFDAFGQSVGVSGNLAIVGAPDHGADDAGAAYVFVSGHEWTEQQKLVPADGFAMQKFGQAVGIADGRAVIGALDNDAGANAGAVYFFRSGGGIWTEITKLTASDAAGGEFYGLAVAMDDSSVIAGAPFNDDNGLFSGSAYVVDAPTEVVPFQLDPALSALDLVVEVPGMAPQPFVIHLVGSVTTTVTPDCNFYSGLHVPTFSWTTLEKSLEIQLPGAGPGSSVIVTDLGINLVTPGAPAALAEDGTGILPDYEIEVLGNVSMQEGGDLDLLETLLVFCVMKLDAGGPAGDLPLALEFPGVDLAFEADLGLGDLNPTVTVTGEVTGFEADPCPWDLDGSGQVSTGDLLSLLSQWGTDPGGPPDFDGSGSVGTSDLLELLANWGPCP